MKNYHDLLQYTLDNGVELTDRTGVGTLSVFGPQLRFDLREGFPAITTKKLAWKAVVGELLWFLEGSSDERRLAELTHGPESLKTTIWTANAQADYWKPKARFEGDLGRVYGVQWRDWRGVDQIKQLIEGLKENPHSRRHILSAWNVDELSQMALPPCHVMSQYWVNNKRELSCHLYARSQDLGLGTVFNVASYALLTHMIAQVCQLGVAALVISMGDAHIYLNHVGQIKEQLLREHFPSPRLWLNPNVTDINDFTPADIRLDGYQHHTPIKMDMAV